MRIRLNRESVQLLEAAAEPGETPQETLARILAEVRDQGEAYPASRFLTFQEVAERWGVSKSLVKQRARQYRESGGKIGLGPVVRLGYRVVLVPREAVEGYEKGGVF